MARRRGFLSRITDALQNIGTALGDFFGTPGEGEEPPRRPPLPPPPPGGAPPREPRSPELRIWRRDAVGRDKDDTGNFEDWLNLYHDAVDPLDMDTDDFLKYWDEFLRAYYLTSHEARHISRDRFHRDIGVRRRDWEMDWDEWRNIKRGTP